MEIKNLPDEDLAVYVREVDHDSFREIVERYEAKLLHFAKAVLGNDLVAHEIVQEAFIETYTHLYQFNSRLKFSSFLYRCVHHQISLYQNHRSHKEQQGTYESFDEEFLMEDDIENEFADKELLKHMRKYVHRLPDKYKEPLILHFFEQKSYDEISEILQISASAIAVRLSVGKSLIKKHA